MKNLDHREVAQTKTIEVDFLGNLMYLNFPLKETVTQKKLHKMCMDKVSCIKYFAPENVLDIYEESQSHPGNLERFASIKLALLNSKLQEAILERNKRRALDTENPAEIEQILTLCLT